VTLAVGRFSGRAEEWDELVLRSPGWTHFHLHGWRGVIERVFGHECLYLAAREGGEGLAGVLPLVRVKSLLFGHYLVSMPFLNYGGPLGSEEAVRALCDHAARLAREDGATLLELRSARPLPVPLTVSHRKITVVLDVSSQDPERLWRGLPAKVRSQVRRPQKEGVQVRFGADQVAPFFEVFSRHMRDLGTPTQARRLFDCIAETFPGDVWFGCAYLGAKPVAAGCGFRWAQEFEMTWASALTEHSRLAPNMLLYWAFIERAAREGLERFNFGRCTPGSGAHRFKRQWGGRDVALWWYQAARRTAATTPSPHQGAFALGPALWKRLPLAVATALGPRVVRYLP
jgi:serine/alanine adding enzyme